MIRPYQEKDLPSLVNILILNTPKYFNIDEVEDFKRHIDIHASDYFVVVDESDTVLGGSGYLITEDTRTAHISWIFFNPKIQKKGYGSVAVNHCIDCIKENGSVSQVIVLTSQLAYRFFETFGFTLQATKEDYWGPGLDYYKMDMEL